MLKIPKKHSAAWLNAAKSLTVTIQQEAIQDTEKLKLLNLMIC